MVTDTIRRVLLHGGRDEGFDQSVRFAWRLVETFQAELHVMYTVDEPLSAGWTAELAAEKLPELHQAMEAEARERLARVIPGQEETVTIAIGTDDAGKELVRYAVENAIDLAIVHANDDHARALLDKGHCSVLFLQR